MSRSISLMLTLTRGESEKHPLHYTFFLGWGYLIYLWWSTLWYLDYRALIGLPNYWLHFWRRYSLQKQSPRGVLLKRCSWKFAKFKGKHLHLKLQVSVCNSIKKETLTQVFSCEFYEISKNTFPYRTPLLAPSEFKRLCYWCVDGGLTWGVSLSWGQVNRLGVGGNYVCCLVMVVIFIAWDLEDQRGKGV